MTSGLVSIFDNVAAARIFTFQVREVEAESMGRLCCLIDYLARNRSLQLVHLNEDEDQGIVTAYLAGDGVSLELLKLRIESVFPELDVSLAHGYGPTLPQVA